MSEKLMEKSCSEFADELAAKVSVPGGGGAAAYIGALGAALCSMVGNFTTGKKKYEAVEEDIQRLLGDAEKVRVRLIQLADEDAAAFFPLSQAYGIPKEDPGRAETLENATKNAIAAPLEMMRQICAAVELLEEMGKKGSRMLISDVGCGALACRAALEAASLNVYINTKGLADRAFAEKTDAECDKMIADYVPRAEKLAADVMAQVKG